MRISTLVADVFINGIQGNMACCIYFSVVYEIETCSSVPVAIVVKRNGRNSITHMSFRVLMAAHLVFTIIRYINTVLYRCFTAVRSAHVGRRLERRTELHDQTVVL